MLRIFGEAGRDCTGVTRRGFVQAGLLGLGGLTLPDLYRLQAAERPSGRTARDTAVILFWLSGGPGHMETWDPKPDAPAEYRGPLGAIRTRLPGVQFGELLPMQAALMDRLAVVRTVNHGSGDHTKSNHWMLTGFEGPAFNAPNFRHQKRPSLGSAVARLRGPNVPGMPPYVAVPHLRGGTDNFFHYAAYLGGGANPFVVESDPNRPDFRVRNLNPPGGLTIDRLESRRHLLAEVERTRRAGERSAADLGEHYQRAFDLLTSPRIASAFAIGSEPASVRDRYGRHTFGQSALLARRLVEAGVTFVTVNCVPWDHHGTPPQLRTEQGARMLIPPLDCAVAGLVEDLCQRGLYERTLVVVMGEFGRTPRLNRDAGRDHWGRTFSVLFGGGGMRMGQVIGRSSPRGEYVLDRPIDPEDVAATVYHHLGIDGAQVAFPDHQGRPLHLIERGRPIRELVG
ncbi:MAG: DUF1501 domain-containing protein [Gemmataceae bacterium]|nr:DUF1501 domain-containing protein [Gemmataceae bacterium]